MNENEKNGRINASRVSSDLTTIQGLAEIIECAGRSQDGGAQEEAFRVIAPAIGVVAKHLRLFIEYGVGAEVEE